MVEYVGTAYAGFQRQPGKVTVQSALEHAIEAATGERVRLIGSGRTDAGAHAYGQVVAFSTSSALPPDKLSRAINAHLPDDIAVWRAGAVSDSFHPRFDARSRTYRYVIWNRPIRSPFVARRAAHVKQPLDVEAMDAAAALLAGSHDFGAFIPVATSGDRRRTVFEAQCWRDGALVQFEIEASGYMRQMIRSMAGTLILVGSGRLTVDGFRDVLLAADRRHRGPTAPAHGLYLVRVRYPGDVADTDRWNGPGYPWLTQGGTNLDKERT